MKNIKNVLITGASSGLGENLYKLYTQKGFKTYGISKNPSQNSDFSNNNSFLKLDLTKIEKYYKIVDFLKNTNKLDLLYLNAGALGEINEISKISTIDLKKTMEINLWANKYILDLLLDLKIFPKQVVAISSGASISGSKGWSGYALSKASLNMLIKLYANEISNTHFISVAPGLIETKMMKNLLQNNSHTEFPSLKRINDSVRKDPKEVAELLDSLLEKFKTLPSGSFVDVREL